jgi:hypothetical protein
MQLQRNTIKFDVSSVIVHLNEFHDVMQVFHSIINFIVWSPLTAMTIISPVMSLINLNIRNMKQNPNRYELISEINKNSFLWVCGTWTAQFHWYNKSVEIPPSCKLKVKKIGKPNNIKIMRARKPKGLNRIAKFGCGHIYTREENLSFNNTV